MVLCSVKLGGSVVTLYIVLLLLLVVLLLLLLLLIHEHCGLESLWLLHLRSSAPEGTWGVVHLLLLLLLLHHKRVRHEDTWSELASLVLLLLAALGSRSGLDVDRLRVRRKGLRD